VVVPARASYEACRQGGGPETRELDADRAAAPARQEEGSRGVGRVSPSAQIEGTVGARRSGLRRAASAASQKSSSRRAGLRTSVAIEGIEAEGNAHGGRETFRDRVGQGPDLAQEPFDGRPGARRPDGRLERLPDPVGGGDARVEAASQPRVELRPAGAFSDELAQPVPALAKIERPGRGEVQANVPERPAASPLLGERRPAAATDAPRGLASLRLVTLIHGPCQP
jgi:hypothetical protein